MPGWFMDIQHVWHLTSEHDDHIIVPCLANMYVFIDSPFYSKRLPETGVVCISCIRCWDIVNMHRCNDG